MRIHKQTSPIKQYEQPYGNPYRKGTLRNELNAGVLFKQDVDLHDEINLGLNVTLDTPFTLLTRNYRSAPELHLELKGRIFGHPIDSM
jgi:hypothetical protein